MSKQEDTAKHSYNDDDVFGDFVLMNLPMAFYDTFGDEDTERRQRSSAPQKSISACSMSAALSCSDSFLTEGDDSTMSCDQVAPDNFDATFFKNA
jgi:hypothetical protein